MKKFNSIISAVVVSSLVGLAIESNFVNGMALESGNASESGCAIESGNAIGNDTKECFTKEYSFLSYFDNKEGKKKVGESYSECGLESIIDAVLETQDDAEEEAKSSYSSYKYVSVSSEYERLNTYNYSQSTLNNYFNSHYSDNKVKGTCSEVASTSAVEYYDRKGYTDIRNFNENGCFCVLMNCAIDTGAWKHNGGKGSTTDSQLKKVISKYYDIYKEDYDGNYDTTFLKTKIYSSIDDGKPVMGAFHVTTKDGTDEGHCMNICGYLEVTVKYKNNKYLPYNSKKIIYYIVNDGWTNCKSGNKRIQYVNSKYLTSITRIV